MSIFFIGICLTFWSASTTLALNFGQEITIYDQSGPSLSEDNEVEGNSVLSQSWDLEGMFLDKYQLTLVGGFDFLSTQGCLCNQYYLSGDLFIDVDGDAAYGQPAAGLDDAYTQKHLLWWSWTADGVYNIPNSYGYDYVLDLDFANRTYDVYQINDNTWLTSVYYRDNDGSNPWQFTPGCNDTPLTSGEITYYDNDNLTDADLGFQGAYETTCWGCTYYNDYHNAFSVDLGFLPENTEFTAHFTMYCGNDNLMGHGVAHAPEPATLLLFGSGILGLAGLSRKRLMSKKEAKI